MPDLAETHRELQIVNDQIGRPTNTDDLAEAILGLIEAKADFGVYNCTNSGKPVTWEDYAKLIFTISKKQVHVSGISTEAYSKDKEPFATRPKYSVLDISKIESIGIKMPEWQESVQMYLKERKEHG